ncbi:MAG: 1-acyl-sn-glycerol-3-phosphate acyltransferase [Planctomycetes bacterium]|nr:1-acyl-sn-glycerol-3-phosphate acyltransferase [Planctomycetota bacterium]
MRLRDALLVAASFAYLGGVALALLALALVTGFSRRDLYGRGAAGASRALLRLWGGRVEVTGAPWPAGQAVYVSNHTAALDVFVVCALGLPRARYFLSGGLRLVAPLAVIGWLIGVFWTPPQTRRERRVALFQRAAATLARTGESAFLTPEGRRVPEGGPGPFNRGAFHLALSLGAPIVPLVIDVPPGTTPGLLARPGVVRVRTLPAIDTRAWRLEDLDRRKDEVRASFTWSS